MNNNIIDFPSPINLKKKKYVKIRDEIERILTAYALEKDDLWAVALASGRFASLCCKPKGWKCGLDRSSFQNSRTPTLTL